MIALRTWSAPLALALALPALAAAARAASPWSEHLAAARAAFGAGEDSLARVHLLALDSLGGGHAPAQASLAVLEARSGRRDAALHWLGALAAAGLVRPLGAGGPYAEWLGEPAFRAVAAAFDSNAVPITNTRPGFALADTAMLAEDVAWDARAQRFLVSSIHRGGIVAVDAKGRVGPFLAPGAHGTWGVYALALDPARRVLWATTVAGPEYAAHAAADSGRTALLALDPRDGRLLRRLELPRTPARQALGDLSLGPDGTVYASEGLGGAVYRLRPGADALEVLVPPGELRSPQGSAVAADGRRLYVADYSRGLAEVDLASRAVRWVPKPYALALSGIDGLYRDGDRLLAIQNGTTPHRVLELTLDPAGARVTGGRVLERASTRLGEPNHGTFAGRDFWIIGDSGWDRVADDGTMGRAPGARPPVLLRFAPAAPR